MSKGQELTVSIADVLIKPPEEDPNKQKEALENYATFQKAHIPPDFAEKEAAYKKQKKETNNQEHEENAYTNPDKYATSFKRDNDKKYIEMLKKKRDENKSARTSSSVEGHVSPYFSDESSNLD